MSAVHWPTLRTELVSDENRGYLPPIAVHTNGVGFSFYTYLTVEQAEALRDQLAHTIECSDQQRYVDPLDDIVAGLEVAMRCECADALLLDAMADALRKVIGSAIDATEARS
jgi:hypothetical protein